MQTQDLSRILNALRFSAEKHKNQRRKGRDAAPYINHPIEVAELLTGVGGVQDPHTIIAAILHDTVEDTATTPEEIEQKFGQEVRSLVDEVTDDKSLPQAVRKQRQIDHAPHLTSRAKEIKIADKISNLRDLIDSPPTGWSQKRIADYIDWSEAVVSRLRGSNPALEELFETIFKRAQSKLASTKTQE